MKIITSHQRNGRQDKVSSPLMRELAIFGSFVRGQQYRKSDVDILVKYHETLGLLKLIEVELYIEKLLKRKVDLIEKKSQSRTQKENSPCGYLYMRETI